MYYLTRPHSIGHMTRNVFIYFNFLHLSPQMSLMSRFSIIPSMHSLFSGICDSRLGTVRGHSIVLGQFKSHSSSVRLYIRSHMLRLLPHLQRLQPVVGSEMYCSEWVKTPERLISPRGSEIFTAEWTISTANRLEMEDVI